MNRFSLRALIAAGPVRAAHVAVLSAGLVLALAMTGCSSGSTAATVNGVAIPESEVTESIQSMRETNGYADDQTWAQVLAYYGMTAESLRTSAINSLAQPALLEQKVKEAGFILTEEDVTEALNEEKSVYATGAEWDAFLETSGTTEEKYKDNVRYKLLCELAEKAGLVSYERATDDNLMMILAYYGSGYAGMPRTSQIQFKAGDTEKAQKVLDAIKSGEMTFDTAARTYSVAPSASKGGDEGFMGIMSKGTAYQSAASSLEEGQMSDLVTDEQGGIHIIKVTDLLELPSEATSLSDYPAELVDMIRESLDESALSEAVSTWLSGLSTDQIKINDMPEGLPYDVEAADLSALSTGDGTEAEADADADADASGEDSDAEVEIVEEDDQEKAA